MKRLFFVMFGFILGCWCPESLPDGSGGAGGTNSTAMSSSTFGTQSSCYAQKHAFYVDGDAGECVLQACELLWGNCDDDVNNGCETILAQDNNCGKCGVICPNPQQCLTVCDDTGATCFTSCQ